jgi:hypothetical protein
MSNLAEPPIQRYMKMGGDDLAGFWFDAYGWIACYFAQLEGLSYALIETLGTADEKVRAAKLPYQPRTDKASEIVLRHFTAEGKVALGEEWVAFLAEAKATAPMRNKILHNPLSVNLALGDPLNDSDAGVVLTHEPGKPKLRLGAVQAFSKQMLDLSLRMQSLLSRSSLVPIANSTAHGAP